MKSGKILVVDDDAELCEELADMIRDQGYTVDTLTDSILGTCRIKMNSYDLVLLDYKMPNLTALEVLREVKATRPETRFIIITGKPYVREIIDRENLSDLVVAVYAKPFSYEKLLTQIRKLIS